MYGLKSIYSYLCSRCARSKESASSTSYNQMLTRSYSHIPKCFIRSVATKHENLTVRAGLDKNPGKVLFVEDKHAYTYGDFMKKTGKFVTLLNQNFGIGKGDRVLSRCTKSLDAVAIYLACLRLGAIYVPVNPSYTKQETEHYVKDSSPKLMITCDEKTDASFRNIIPAVIREQSLAKESRKMRATMDIENVNSDDVACICYTSGTTGVPKGAMLTHGSLSSNAEALVNLWRFKHDDRLLHSLPFYHVHGMFISLNCSLFSHSTVIWRDRFAVDDVLRWLPQTTVLMGVPTYYSRLLESAEFRQSKFWNVRLFVSGSAPLSLAVWDEFKAVTRHSILERYGMTESSVICSNLYEEEGRKAGSVGRPIDNTKLRLNDGGGIEIKSNSVFAGYWKNPEKTKKEFTDDGWFITGDVGRVDDDGFVYILGRSKDLVITGGLNVYPKQIEDILDRMKEVNESAIIGIPNRDLGESVVAVVALKDANFDAKTMENLLIQRLKVDLAGYKVPKRVVFVPVLPRNSMAKVQKNVLREQFKEIET